jgi:enoyl-CoA hydratase/carnithine racemase
MSTEPKVRFVQGPLGTVTLDSPPLNLIGADLIADLVAAIAEVEAADGARALVLRGAGKVFSAGAHVALFAGMRARLPTRCCSAVRTDTELGLPRRWEVDDD